MERVRTILVDKDIKRDVFDFTSEYVLIRHAVRRDDILIIYALTHSFTYCQFVMQSL